MTSTQEHGSRNPLSLNRPDTRSRGSNELKESFKKTTNDKIRLTFLSLLVFIAGLPSTQTLNVIGELFITELLLPPLALILVLSGKTRVFRLKLFWWFVLAGICLMAGYFISDLVAGTEPSKYIRAWGRNLILITNIVSLAIIAGSDRRLIWWFVLGIAAGSLFLLLRSHVPLSDWKFGYGKPLVYMVLLVGYFLPYRLTVIMLLAFGAVSIYLDNRSMGAVCLIIASIVFVRVSKPNGLKLSPSAVFRILVAGALVLTLTITILTQTQEQFSLSQRGIQCGSIYSLGYRHFRNQRIPPYRLWFVG